MQIMIKYYIVPLFYTSGILTTWQFILVVLATISIAIGGYIINDIYDIDIDKINKPERNWIPSIVSIDNAKLMYYSTTFIGLLLGAYVSIITGSGSNFIWFILPATLLFFYAVSLKKKYLIGNILVASLVATSLLVVAYFENNLAAQSIYIFTFWSVIWTLIFFAFGLNLIREIIKDAEDIIGDQANGVQSIPIKHGVKTTNFIISILSSLLIGMLLTISFFLYKTQLALSLYLIFAVVMGFVLFLKQLNKTSTSPQYHKLSNLLKLLMLVGLFSVFLIQI